MRLLLDTCAFLWLIVGADELSVKAEDLFKSSGNEVFLSVVSGWEIAVKYALGRLDLPKDPRQYVPDQREKHSIAILALDEASALQVSALPGIHNDPFDRMLVSQALMNDMTLLTPDAMIRKYPVRTVW